MVKHTQTICWLLLTNCLSVFDHFVGLLLQRLIDFIFPLVTDWNISKHLTSRKSLAICHRLVHIGISFEILLNRMVFELCNRDLQYLEFLKFLQQILHNAKFASLWPVYKTFSLNILENVLTLPTRCISESCIKIKII